MIKAVMLIVIIMIIAVLFIFLLPIWLWMNYRSNRYQQTQIGQQDYYQIEKLAEQAKQMQERIDALEAILDAEQPRWRHYQ